MTVTPKPVEYQDHIRAFADSDFIKIGLQIFESDDLIERLLAIYVSLSAKGWSMRDDIGLFGIGDVGWLYHNGLSLCCTQRIAIAGQIDLRNDGIARSVAIPVGEGRSDEFSFIRVERIDAAPPGWSALPFHQGLVKVARFGRAAHDRGERKYFGSDDLLNIYGWLYCLVNDRLLPCKARDFPYAAGAADLAVYASGALQTAAEMRGMWHVETEESVISLPTPIKLGVDAEIVKSLFYARQAPLSESGRRRPILHWVRSHQRRLATGIDIDIEKHLRGVTEFEMDGFPFRIVQPLKRQLARAA